LQRIKISKCRSEIIFFSNYSILLKTYSFFVDKNECNVFERCKNNGTCLNNNGSYVCNCTEGWKGHDCEEGKVYNCKYSGKNKLFVDEHFRF
jgi:hypothetical protein